MNMTLKQQIKQLAKTQYHVHLGEFIYFSSASELIVWLSADMTPFELEHLAYRLGNTHVEELQKSGCDTPAEASMIMYSFYKRRMKSCLFILVTSSILMMSIFLSRH